MVVWGLSIKWSETGNCILNFKYKEAGEYIKAQEPRVVVKELSFIGLHFDEVPNSL